MKTLIIGAGEIGKSLFGVLSDHAGVLMMDKDTAGIPSDIEILHICFPYSEKFIKYVKDYQKQVNPIYTVIHSTVPVGTSRKCNAIHSPCIGIHPHLEESLRTFTKFLGGIKASLVADYFRRAGFNVYLTDKQETTELMKIASTTFYALCIEYIKDLKRQCRKNDIPFEMWSIWTENYNKGYKQLGYNEYSRPNLNPIMNMQGGHCTISNLALYDSIFSSFVKKLNSGQND